MAIEISVCIPVYNCAEFIGHALDSILPQTDSRTEVIVFDGASTDETPLLMKNYISVWPNLTYHRSLSRGGIDADLASCVNLAQGEYLWLFSGDDVMRPGAINRAITLISKRHDVYLYKHTLCNKHMDILQEYPALDPDVPFLADFTNLNSRREWFKRATTSEAFFSFMSGLLVRRSKWMNGRLADEFKGSCWGHVIRLFELISSGLWVFYVAEVWLDKRGANDSFAENGVVNRYKIAIDGYNKIADSFFGHDSIEAFHIRRVIRYEFTLTMFLSAKLLCKEYPLRENREILDNLVRETYSDTTLINLFKHSIYSVLPVRLYAITRQIYRLTQSKPF